MNNLANDLRIEGRIANDLLTESDQIINRHPAAMIAAARSEQSRLIADMLLTAGRAIVKFIKRIPWTTNMEAHHYKKAVDELEALSDRMLADIGVERRMIPEVVRSLMADETPESDVVYTDNRVSTGRKTTPVAANCNKMEKHHHAA